MTTPPAPDGFETPLSSRPATKANRCRATGPKPLWPWSSWTGTTPSHVDNLWRAVARRFDLEHMSRLFEQSLGWTTPRRSLINMVLTTAC
jgi:hypothetical protein